jgi:hypothetical protein
VKEKHSGGQAPSTLLWGGFKLEGKQCIKSALRFFFYDKSEAYFFFKSFSLKKKKIKKKGK